MAEAAQGSAPSTTPDTGPKEQAPVSDVEAQQLTEPAGEDLTSSPKAVERKKYKVKVDGKDSEVDEAELIKSYQLQKTITKRAQEASELKRQATQERDTLAQFLDTIKTNPQVFWQLATKLGHDPDKLAEEKVWNKIQFEKLSPEERLARQTEMERDELKQKLLDLETKQKQEAEAQLTQQIDSEIEDDIIEVSKLSGIKLTPRVVARIAEIYDHKVSAIGVKPSRAQVAKQIRQWIDQDLSEYVSAEDIAKLVDRLPADFLNRLSKHQLSRAQKGLPGDSPSAEASSDPKGNRKEKMGIDRWFKSL